MSQKLVRTFLLVKVFDDGRVFSGQVLKTLLSSGIGYAASIENETSSITALVFRGTALMEGEAEDLDRQNR